jgi:hypothetical protein
VARAGLVGGAAVGAVDLQLSMASSAATLPGMEVLGWGVLVCACGLLSLLALAATRIGAAAAVWLLAAPATVAVLTLLRGYLRVPAGPALESPGFPAVALFDVGVGAVVFAVAAWLTQPPLDGRRWSLVAAGGATATCAAWLLLAWV